MSETQNKTMVICIIAFIAIGSLLAGVLAFYGTSNFTWSPYSQYGINWNPAELTEFQFEDDTSTMSDSTTLRVNISASIVNVKFEHSNDLLYRFDMLVPNQTVQDYGNPVVEYASNTVSLNYPAAAVNITLGSGTNYTMDIDIITGAAELIIADYSHVGDIDVDISAGELDFLLSDDSSIFGDVDVTLTVDAGQVSITVDLPTNVGGDFEGSTGFGAVDVTTTTWTEITPTHYRTSNYDTAPNTLSILASTNAGEITANLL
ncbi:MAG: hypothetical protein GF411_01085 [Candidatus Lokiarchaeota archaeon]|nr:hypothetical protein [Candidatus Lokiarchaeota archaeon]